MPSTRAPFPSTLPLLPPLSKAQGVNSFITVVREMVGPERWPHYVSKLSPATRALIDTPPMAVAWVSDEHWNALNIVLRETAFKGKPDQLIELGRRQMHRDLNSFYRFLMHLVSPETVVRKAATIYGTYTKNGHMKAAILAPRHVQVTVEGVEDPIPETWLFHIGSITGTLECAGAKGIAVKVREGGGLQAYCVYDATWVA